MPKLNKSTIDNAPVPTKGDTWIWDSELQGFGIRVQPGGRRTYVVRYRTANDKTQRKATIARCSDMPPDKARELARKLFTQVAEGKDPVQERRIQADQEAPKTVADLKEAYMAKHATPFKKEASAALDETTWSRHILPHMGTRSVRSITEEDVLDIKAALKGKPAVANQVIAVLSKAMNLAEKWNWRDKHTNPCADVPKYRIKERELILSPDELGRLERAMVAMVDERVITQPMANMVRLLMLTGCRLREIMHAEREWVDTNRCLLILPDSKVGQRRIALSPAAMDVIASMPPGEKWLIPGRVHGEALVTPYKPWAKIKRRAYLPKELRLHDLRHSFGSLAHMAGMSQKQIATALGHKQLQTTERYLHGRAGDTVTVAATVGALVTGAWGSKPAHERQPA